MKDSKTYRIRTKLGSESDSVINVQLEQTFDTFEILSLKLDQKNAYKLYQSDYGVIVGRVIANGGFGVPNAKVSIFIESEEDDDFTKRLLYPYKSTMATNFDGIRYNLLPDYVDDACHQNIGTFPNKRLVLDNNDIIDIYDQYYVYTTVTNNAGDYMIFGVPTGSQKLHVDLDLSDIGMLSQRPRDLMYKGYKETDFESPNKFKKSTNLNSLAQVYTQDKGVYVYPFWGDTTESKDNIAVTRCDIELSYKFEPTCVFMGSIVTDTGSNSISKNCAGSTESGKMSELVSGEGTIEMIRKTIDNKVESFQIRGNRLIDGDGVWCYQIPMNLDYIMTDEYGNIVPSDNPEKGIPTRTRVRFRISLDKVPNDNTARNRCQYLVPNNPRLDEERYPDFTKTKEVDYEFGTNTKDENYRDLFWNKVYTVKNYIPRLQKNSWVKNRKHTGIKLINHFGDNNPMPYNNMNIKLTFQYRLICVIAKVFINLIRFLNQILTILSYPFCLIANVFKGICKALRKAYKWPIIGKLARIIGAIPCTLYDGAMAAIPSCIEISSEFCGDNVTHNNTFYPGCGKIMFTNTNLPGECIWRKTSDKHEERQIKDKVPQEELTQPSRATGELYNCVESALAEDNDVVSFNFHNDWVNGVLYAPLWFRKITPKKRLFFGLFKRSAKDQWCSSEMLQNKKLKLFSPCAILREKEITYTDYKASSKKAHYMDASMKCGKDMEKQNCLNKRAFIGLHNGIIVKRKTILDEDVYYYQAAEFDHDSRTGNSAIEGTPIKEQGFDGAVKLLFATDIVLLGSLNDCDLQGVPQFFKSLESTTYKMPPTLLFTDNVMITTIDDDGNPQTVGSEDGETITTTQESKTEMTGADWGNMNDDICEGSKNEEKSQDSGLFYSIGCNSQRTLPKSCINLSRICEFGVSLDESSYILTKQPTENGSDDDFYEYLVPDGFVSKDELYNIDERSAFASLNNNGLHTKLSEKTGLMEYDFDYLFVDNFDNSLRGHMEARQKKCSKTYKYNYLLEQFSEGYYDFRMGNKPYYYDGEKYNQKLEKNRQPSGWSLPRYENSFYFYFGLKHGKTALDKFNSQFVSSCYSENEEFDNIGIETMGNDWCSDLIVGDRNGYVAFDLSAIDLPCELIIRPLDDTTLEDYVYDVSDEKIYISTWSKAELEAMSVSELQTLLDALTELENKGYVHVPGEMLKNGSYDVIITDKNGEIITTSFKLHAEYLKCNVVGTNFDYSDKDLLAMFNYNRDLIMRDTTGIETTISIDSTREIGGTIAVSFPFIYNDATSKNEEIRYFRIELYGVQNTDGSGYTYNQVFERNSRIVSHDALSYNENKNNNEIGVILFGLPKPNECYTIKVTELCKDGSNFTPSGNVVIYTVCIREKRPFKLFINDVDYDLISDWACGFKNKKRTSADVDDTGNGYEMSDSWVHMSEEWRYRWYKYTPYLELDSQFVNTCKQMHNYVDNQTSFLSDFSGSKFDVLYADYFANNREHILFSLNDTPGTNYDNPDDITKRSGFWELDMPVFIQEANHVIAERIGPDTYVYVSDRHVSKGGQGVPETISDAEYNSLYDEIMYKYTTKEKISDSEYTELPSYEKDKCELLLYVNKTNTTQWITQSEYNNLTSQEKQGYAKVSSKIDDFYARTITLEQYDLLSETCKAYYTWSNTVSSYRSIDGDYHYKTDCSFHISSELYDTIPMYLRAISRTITETEYNTLSASEKQKCEKINEYVKDDFYELTIIGDVYETLNDTQKSHFTQVMVEKDYDDTLVDLLKILIEIVEQVVELKKEVINNVKMTFQLNCGNESKSIMYRVSCDDMPVTYREVHKEEEMTEENDFQTVQCGYEYNEKSTIDNITIPTITTKDSKYYGDENNNSALVMRKAENPSDGVYRYNGTASYANLMISEDKRSDCSKDKSKKRAYFVAVTNSKYDTDPNRSGTTIPERYRTGDDKLGFLFGYHIIDKMFDVNKLAWSVTDNVPYFMVISTDYVNKTSGDVITEQEYAELPQQEKSDYMRGSVNGLTPNQRRIFVNEYVRMNGLFTGTIRNGNASYYDTYISDGDKKCTHFDEQELGYSELEIYTYRDQNETDETVEDKMPTMRYITGVISGEVVDKNYLNYAIGMEDNRATQDSDMWQHTDQKEYYPITEIDDAISLKDNNDCRLDGSIDPMLKIMLSSDSVNDCKDRDNTKFGLTIENCSDNDGLIYYVFEVNNGNTISYPLNKAYKSDMYTSHYHVSKSDSSDGYITGDEYQELPEEEKSNYYPLSIDEETYNSLSSDKKRYFSRMFLMDVGCVGSYSSDKNKSFTTADPQYLYTVYNKVSIDKKSGTKNDYIATIGNVQTTEALRSTFDDEQSGDEYDADGWSTTGDFYIRNKSYPTVYAVAITSDNTRTISPVYDYRYVCVKLIYGKLYSVVETSDEYGNFNGYEYTESGKMTFDVSNIYDHRDSGNINKILYYFYNFPYNVSFESKINDVSTLTGSYTHTSYVDNPEGYVLFDVNDDEFDTLKKMKKVTKKLKKNTVVEVTDATGLKHIAEWNKDESKSCFGIEEKAWVTVTWVTNGGVWNNANNCSDYIGADCDCASGTENCLYGSDETFTRVFSVGETYNPYDVGTLVRDECGQCSGWADSFESMTPVQNAPITIEGRPEESVIYYALWGCDFTTVVWEDCDGSEIAREENVRIGTVFKKEDMPETRIYGKRITYWWIEDDEHPIDLVRGYEISGETTFHAHCAELCPAVIVFQNQAELLNHPAVVTYFDRKTLKFDGSSLITHASYAFSPPLSSIGQESTYRYNNEQFEEGTKLSIVKVDALESEITGCNVLNWDENESPCDYVDNIKVAYLVQYPEINDDGGDANAVVVTKRSENKITVVFYNGITINCDMKLDIEWRWGFDRDGDGVQTNDIVRYDTQKCYGERFNPPRVGRRGYTFINWLVTSMTIDGNEIPGNGLTVTDATETSEIFLSEGQELQKIVVTAIWGVEQVRIDFNTELGDHLRYNLVELNSYIQSSLFPTAEQYPTQLSPQDKVFNGKWRNSQDGEVIDVNDFPSGGIQITAPTTFTALFDEVQGVNVTFNVITSKNPQDGTSGPPYEVNLRQDTVSPGNKVMSEFFPGYMVVYNKMNHDNGEGFDHVWIDNANPQTYIFVDRNDTQTEIAITSDKVFTAKLSYYVDFKVLTSVDGSDKYVSISGPKLSSARNSSPYKLNMTDIPGSDGNYNEIMNVDSFPEGKVFNGKWKRGEFTASTPNPSSEEIGYVWFENNTITEPCTYFTVLEDLYLNVSFLWNLPNGITTDIHGQVITDPTPQSVKYEEHAIAPQTKPEINDYEFGGWFIDGDPTGVIIQDEVVNAMPIRTDMTFKAAWMNVYQINFNVKD